MQEYKLGEVKSVKQPQKVEVETTETVEVAKPKKVKIVKGEN